MQPEEENERRLTVERKSIIFLPDIKFEKLAFYHKLEIGG